MTTPTLHSVNVIHARASNITSTIYPSLTPTPTPTKTPSGSPMDDGWLRFSVDGNPAPWTAQNRNAERSPAFHRMQAWQTQIALTARHAWFGAGRETLTGPVDLRMQFILAEHQTTKRYPDGPDGSNLWKAAEDSLKGIIFEDDDQVFDWAGGKSPSSRFEGVTHIWVRPHPENRSRGVSVLDEWA